MSDNPMALVEKVIQLLQRQRSVQQHLLDVIDAEIRRLALHLRPQAPDHVTPGRTTPRDKPRRLPPPELAQGLTCKLDLASPTGERWDAEA